MRILFSLSQCVQRRNNTVASEEGTLNSLIFTFQCVVTKTHQICSYCTVYCIAAERLAIIYTKISATEGRIAGWADGPPPRRPRRHWAPGWGCSRGQGRALRQSLDAGTRGGGEGPPCAENASRRSRRQRACSRCACACGWWGCCSGRRPCCTPHTCGASHLMRECVLGNLHNCYYILYIYILEYKLRLILQEPRGKIKIKIK